MAYLLSSDPLTEAEFSAGLGSREIDDLESPGSSEFLPPVRGGSPPDRIRAADGFSALAAMVRSGRGPSPFRAWRSLLPGANHRILPEAAPARRGGRCIGSAIALLPLLACCGLLPPASTLARPFSRPPLPRRRPWWTWCRTQARGLTYLSAETLGSLSSTGFSARTCMKVLK